MIKVIPNLDSNGRIPLGGKCDFKIVREQAAVETRCYLKHEGVFYPRAIAEWNSSDSIRFFPEAPGRYELVVQWRSPGGQAGQCSESFVVFAGYTEDELRKRSLKSRSSILGFRPKGSPSQPVETPQFAPTSAPVEGQSRQLWAPSEWESRIFAHHEAAAFDALSTIVKPGWTIYDIGANIGTYSVWFSRLVGARGHVYCFEPNPVCVYFLMVNFQDCPFPNYDIFPVALLESEADTSFVVNYANSALGITDLSSVYHKKIGQELKIRSDGLDHFADQHHLARPDLIKIDIEGAEASAIAGMKGVLSRFKPVVMLEVHGRAAAEPSFSILSQHGYVYREVNSGAEFSSLADLLQWLPEAVMQFVCLPPAA